MSHSMVNDAKNIITFKISSNTFGISVGEVSEVINRTNCSKIYQAPPSVIGIMNLRGRLVTIIDLKKKLGFVREPDEALGMSIIVEDQGEPFGLEVGLVGDIVPNSELINVNEISQSKEQWTQYCKTIKRSSDGLIAVLDLKHLLNFNHVA